MTTAADIETALRSALPAELHAHIPDLARLLADAAQNRLPQADVQQRLATDPNFVPLLQSLAGQTLAAGPVTVSFAGGDQRGANIPIGNVLGRDLVTISTAGGD